MTFLNPLVFFGLAAASIPILLHIFSLRKLQKVDFSTLSFLKELQKTKIRRLKLRQLLLLVLRTSLIILIVTAFARPTMTTAGGGARTAHAMTTAVFIVDNSYSMTSLDEGGELLQEAKEEAVRVLQLLKDGDEMVILRTSDAANPTLTAAATSVRDLSTARAELRSIEPAYLHVTLEDALRTAARILGASRNLNKELYVFSDFKKGSLRNTSGKTGREKILPENIRIYLVPFGKTPRENLCVESVQMENALLAIGKPVSIKARIRNWGEQDRNNEVISVFLNGTKVAQKALDIPAQNWAETEFSFVPSTTGYNDGTVELQDDDLDFDNRRSFAVYIPPVVRTLLVGTAADLRYIRLALDAQSAQGAVVIKSTGVVPERLSTNDIGGADVIVIANVSNLSTPQRMQIHSFLEHGGGVVFFPGSQVDSSSFQSVWAAALDAPSIASIEKMPQQHGQSAPGVEFDRIDFRHPIFQGMFEEERLQLRGPHPETGHPALESPDIHSHVRYQLDVRSNPVITLSDGSPFLFEQKAGKGVAVFFAVSATPDYSDFPTQGLFVPLLHSSISYSSQRRSVVPEFTVGQVADIDLGNVGLGKIAVQNPQRTEIACAVTNSGDESGIRFQGTSIPGVYAVKSGNALLKQFIVNINPAESNTTKASDNEIESLLQQMGASSKSVNFIGQNADIQKIIVQSRVGVELWKFFVAVALVLALIESVVARASRRETGPEQAAAGAV